MPKAADRHIEDFRRTGLVSRCSLKGSNNIVFLSLRQIGLKVYSLYGEVALAYVSGFVFKNSLWQPLGGYVRRSLQRDRPFDRILQLTNVAGPVIGFQVQHRFL